MLATARVGSSENSVTPSVPGASAAVTSRRPKPATLLRPAGTSPAYCPAIGPAPLTKNAFSNAPDGATPGWTCPRWLTRCWRTSAAAPATNGVAMLVPPLQQ